MTLNPVPAARSNDPLPVGGLYLCGSGNHRQQSDQKCSDQFQASVRPLQVQSKGLLSNATFSLRVALRYGVKPYRRSGLGRLRSRSQKGP